MLPSDTPSAAPHRAANSSSLSPSGRARLSLVLHAHLPYVLRHGTWPHGMEWLHEATAEVYLPLLDVLTRLERDRVGFHAALILSPILLEQLASPFFQREFPLYLTRKITAAREDEAFFEQSDGLHYSSLARLWQARFTAAQARFTALDGDLLSGFRHFRDAGMLTLLTSAATHAYLPLLGTDGSVRAQVRLAVQTHERLLGEHPRGIWSPECGFRPAGLWSQPVPNPDGATPAPSDRISTDQAFAESALDFFYLDAPLITSAEIAPTPDSAAAPLPPRKAPTPLTGAAAPHPAQDPQDPQDPQNRLYHPWFLAPAAEALPPVTVFPRDPRTAFQVWSTEGGYPAEPAYLDFHKKRWPGGHRYWRVTDARSDMNGKEPYNPELAADRVQSHAAHFAHTLWQALSPHFADSTPAILSAPFDAELFGHWWFEGPDWLEAVARTLHQYEVGITPESPANYLDHNSPVGALTPREGSWGAGNDHRVWSNPATHWAWSLIYGAEHTVAHAVAQPLWQTDPLARRTVQQLCRELLLLESSDWHSLITTGAARDYAEARLRTHHDQFTELFNLWSTLLQGSTPTAEQLALLAAIEERDSIFPDLDPALWL